MASLASMTMSGTISTRTPRGADHRLPHAGAKKPAKAGKGRRPRCRSERGADAHAPEVTQKGNAIIGDLRTDALHSIQAGGDRRPHVDRPAGSGARRQEREHLRAPALIIGAGRPSRRPSRGRRADGGRNTVRIAARSMRPPPVLSRQHDQQRQRRRIAATRSRLLYLPNMATDEFLSCLFEIRVEKAPRPRRAHRSARQGYPRA